jgi:hypothetical protein
MCPGGKSHTKGREFREGHEGFGGESLAAPRALPATPLQARRPPSKWVQIPQPSIPTSAFCLLTSYFPHLPRSTYGICHRFLSYERMLKSDVKYRFVIDMATMSGT